MKFSQTAAYYPPDTQPLTSKDVLVRTSETSADNRRLLWFLWDCSRQAGGYEGLASALMEMFPDRLQSKTMAGHPNPPGGKYDVETALAIEEEVEGQASWEKGTNLTWEAYKQRPLFDDQEYDEKERRADWLSQTTPQIDGSKLPRRHWLDRCRNLACENLAVLLRNSLLPDSEQTRELNGKFASEQSLNSPFPPQAPWFQDLAGALREYQRGRREFIISNHYQTDIGETIWNTLDTFLESRRPCVIIGKPGIGKSQNLRAWCAAHAGEAVFFSTPSYGTQNEFFHRLGQTLGIQLFSGVSSAISRPRLERVLRESGMALVIDESHFLLDRKDTAGRPPLINWIDSLTDCGVPVAICATPQFTSDLKSIETKTGWALGQFTRRFADQWVVLPEATSIRDLENLAERLLPSAGAGAWKKAAIFASRRRDVSGLADLVRAAHKQAEDAGREEATQTDFDRALKSRLAHESAMEASLTIVPRRGKIRAAATPAPENTVASADAESSEASALAIHRPALAGAQEPPAVRRGTAATLGADASEPHSSRRATTLPVSPSQRSMSGLGSVNRPLNSPLSDRREDSANEFAADLDPTAAA